MLHKLCKLQSNMYTVLHMRVPGSKEQNANSDSPPANKQLVASASIIMSKYISDNATVHKDNEHNDFVRVTSHSCMQLPRTIALHAYVNAHFNYFLRHFQKMENLPRGKPARKVKNIYNSLNCGSQFKFR
jgi:hypothetical protein